MAAVGLGLFVSSIAKTMQQAMLYAFLLVMPFALAFRSDDTVQQYAGRPPNRHDHQSRCATPSISPNGFTWRAPVFAVLLSDFVPLARHWHGNPYRRCVAVQATVDLSRQ